MSVGQNVSRSDALVAGGAPGGYELIHIRYPPLQVRVHVAGSYDDIRYQNCTVSSSRSSVKAADSLSECSTTT